MLYVFYVSVFLLAFIIIFREVQQSFSIKKAELRMAELMHLKFSQQKLESLRDRLLSVKKQAIANNFKEMEIIYAVERELNQLSTSLDNRTHHLINEGLRQTSDKGRVSYMLKLVDMSMGINKHLHNNLIMKKRA